MPRGQKRSRGPVWSAIHSVSANADRRGFLKDDSRQRVRCIGRRENLEQMPRPSFLHLNRNRENIEGAGGEQLLRGVAKVLRSHVIDVRLDDDDIA